MKANAPAWIAEVRDSLYRHWVSHTGHDSGRNSQTWACEIVWRCRTCDEHLSLPCSLLEQANDIGAFLRSTCFDNHPRSFLRLFLVVLGEFCGQLSDAAGLMRLPKRGPPKTLMLWCNWWAKHSLHVLVQHHPALLFEDDPSQSDVVSAVRGRSVDHFIDSQGHRHPLQIMDTDWFRALDSKSPDLKTANDDVVAIVVVPRLRVFLEELCSYYRQFVDDALAAPERVRQFESRHFYAICRDPHGGFTVGEK